MIAERAASVPTPARLADVPIDLASVALLNQRLTGLPCVAGTSVCLHDDPKETLAAMTQAVRDAKKWVYVEFYIMAWDHVTDPFFRALADAVARGVLPGNLMAFAGAFADAQPPAQAGDNPWAPWLEAWQQALPAAFSDYLGAINPAAPRGRK